MSYQQFGHVDPEERLDYSDEAQDEWPQRRRPLRGAALALSAMALFAGMPNRRAQEAVHH